MTQPSKVGSFVLLVLFTVATVLIGFDGLITPQHRYVSLGLFLVGLLGMWRQYARLKRR